MEHTMSQEKPIYVTKTFLPPKEEYEKYLDKIWQSDQLTNNGPLLSEFEVKTKEYLGVENFLFVTNGTLALQLALRALDITEGEIITTPFSYVATTSAILWEHCTPVYVDIDPHTLNINPAKIESAITNNTKAILAVHVFGNPCDVEAIEKIAKKYNLKVIYDAAHAFGVRYKGKSLLYYGDISICSFHATKLFHTIEGGGIVTRDPVVHEKTELIRRFGHNGDEHIMLGINAKASEFQAAMGLCNLKYVDRNIKKRKQLSELYDKLLGSHLHRPRLNAEAEYNYGYYPIIFKDEMSLLKTFDKLNVHNIYPRRYFYPSLNKLSYLASREECPESEDIALRIACLPLYADIDADIVTQICEIINV
jgi:dTDP-4-amino-4,6-dideoxygalactose transaminase